MIAHVRALAYLEYRQIINRILQALHQPARAVMYLLVFGYFIVITVVRQHGNRAFALVNVPEPYASTLFFAYLTFLGILMYGAASGIVGAFSSASDARFLSGSPIPEPLVVLWLQLRRSAAAVGRMAFTVLIYALIFSRSGTLAGIGLATIGGTIVATGTAIPMLKLRRIVGKRSAQSLASVVAAAGILPMIVLLTSLQPGAPTLPWARSIEHFGLGYAFNAIFGANPLALGALYAAGFGVIALSYACGKGLYPDLYASSLRVLAFRERQTRASAGFNIEHRYEHRETALSHAMFRVFRGPWTVVWKEWIAFVRSPSMQRMFYFGLLVCAGVGGFFGHVVAGSRNEIEEALGLAYMAGNMIVIFVAMGSAIGLSSDISKPLWWMGGDPLWLRLVAWTAATSWRLAACIGIGIAVWALVLHAGVIAVAGIPVAITLVLHLRAVGLVIYSIFPSTIDQRGPLAIVRATLTYLFAAPPAVVGTVLLIMHPMQPIWAIAGGVACSLLETLLLVALASRRIGGQGVAFARAEAM
ncbi:MAG TPA: putative ABC exporter domain-containing protein [Candidatus Baltobacteraceae bacterium]|nr:putative ABC exporter domain-containing protein [Candidatus Baltobacteraceae bacterium]